MRFMKRMVGCVASLVVGLGLAGNGSAGENCPDNAAPKERTSVDIGMPDTLFQGVPEILKRLGGEPFKKMMKKNTGIDGVIHFPPDAMTLAAKLDSGEIQIGVMQGHEYAWAKSKYPCLMPIAIAVPMHPVQSFCVVRWNCPAVNIGQLKDGKLSVPPVHRDFSCLYLDKIKNEHMKGAEFSGQLNALTGCETIDQVIDGKSDCAIVDCSLLKTYELLYPGPFKATKVLCQSEVFPNACIVVKKNVLVQQTITKFTEALIKAENDPSGKPMLVAWKVKRFTTVPDDYEQQIKQIEKAYPLPPVVKASIEK